MTCLLCIYLHELLGSGFSVAPDTINNHVKTCREEQKSLHFFAPEYGGEVPTNSGMSTGVLGCENCCGHWRSVSAFSGRGRHHSRGYLFLWNVRLGGNWPLIIMLAWCASACLTEQVETRAVQYIHSVLSPDYYMRPHILLNVGHCHIVHIAHWLYLTDCCNFCLVFLYPLLSTLWLFIKNVIVYTHAYTKKDLTT